MPKNSGIVAAALALGLALVVSSCAQTSPTASGASAFSAQNAFYLERLAAAGGDLAKRCDAMNHLDLDAVGDAPARVTATSVVIGKKTAPREKTMFVKRGHSQGSPTPPLDEYPPHCRIEGYIAPQTKFVLLLPLEKKSWNERFMLAACDGFCGAAHPEAPVPGLYRGFATITNNGGHDSRAPFDAVWAYNNREGEIDFGYRANHITAQVGKAITEAYYGAKPKFSYLAGFSKGGNAGVVSAQRYPDDFDGIFSKAPVVEYQAKNNAHFPWIARAAYPDGKTPVMFAEKVPVLQNGVMKACDEIDGLKDSVIQDPRKCTFDPVALLCKPSEDESKCLTSGQVEAVRKIYTQPTDKDGKIYYHAAENFGSEGDWGRFIFPEAEGVNIGYSAWGGAGSLRYLAFEHDPGPGYDWTSFDYPTEHQKLDFMSEILDADSPDMKAFKETGGKIIIVHGWADGAISAQMTISWFEKVQAFMGGRAATGEFAQLYVVPGIKHGSGGTAPYEYDAIGPLMKWVEEGIAPSQLMMVDDMYVREGTPEWVTVQRTRPAFPWPARYQWDGKGDPNVASSFVRVED